MFKKILVPVDGSAGSQNALKLAASFAKQFSGELILCHAAELRPNGALPGDFVGWSAGFMVDAVEAIREEGKRIIDEAKSKISKDFPSAKTYLEIGSPVQLICELAEKEKCDLIVMGSRGLSDFKGVFLGSVSHGVLQRSHCPVLLTKEDPVSSKNNKTHPEASAVQR